MDEVTMIDGLKEIKLSNAGCCCVGEGSYGSEGFIACLDKDHKLIWVLYSEESNPFIDVKESATNIITTESSSGVIIKIDVNRPLGLEIIFTKSR